jgi:hypothetical protein
MKKRYLLFALILIVGSCTVQKKQLYVFSYYGYITKADGTLKDPGETIHPNLITEPVVDTIHHDLGLINTADSTVKREVRLLKQPKLHPRRINKVINEQRIASEKKGYSTEISQLVEKKKRKNADRLLYMVASLMGIAVIGLTRLFRPLSTTITRWAKANPKTTQGLIAGLHLPLLGLGVMNGHNLYQMGYDTSETMMYTFGAATALGFLSTPFLPKRDIIAMPKKVNLQRLAFAGLTISSLMMMVGLGNKTEQKYPHSPITKAVQSIDNALYASDTHSIEPTSKKALKAKILGDRKKDARISAGGAALAIFFLVLLACAGICLLVGGVASAFSGGAVLGSLAIAVFGGFLSFFAIKGISDISHRRRLTREKEEQEQKQKQGL